MRLRELIRSSTRQFVSAIEKIIRVLMLVPIEKIKVLSLLNQELFEEVFKREEEELRKLHHSSFEFHTDHMFGQQIGHLLHLHATLEQSFKQNNVGPDSKMIPLDDEFLPEEAKQVAINIRKTIAQLVRHFA